MSHGERHRDGRRNPARGRIQGAVAIALAGFSAAVVCSTVHGGVIDLNGGTSWGGWTSVGNSQTAGMWVRGSTSRSYDIYSTQFTLESSQAVDGSATGDTAASLFTGSWMAGDRILGVGFRYSDASRLATIWVHVDWAGDSIMAASSVGAGDGVYSANAGDLSLFASRSVSGGKLRVHQYSVFTGFSADGGSNFGVPYGMGASTSAPVRAFTVFDGSAAASVQYLVNLDAISRSNGGTTFGEGQLGSATKLGFLEADPVWNYSQQVFTLPTPGAAALIAMACMPVLGMRSRRRCLQGAQQGDRP